MCLPLTAPVSRLTLPLVVLLWRSRFCQPKASIHPHAQPKAFSRFVKYQFSSPLLRLNQQTGIVQSMYNSAGSNSFNEASIPYHRKFCRSVSDGIGFS